MGYLDKLDLDKKLESLEEKDKQLARQTDQLRSREDALSKRTGELDQVIQQNASAAEELASTSEELAGQGLLSQTELETTVLLRAWPWKAAPSPSQRCWTAWRLPDARPRSWCRDRTLTLRCWLIDNSSAGDDLRPRDSRNQLNARRASRKRSATTAAVATRPRAAARATAAFARRPTRRRHRPDYRR